MSKPVIAVLSSTQKGSSARFGTLNQVYVNQSYINAIIANGGIPMIVPPFTDTEMLYPILEKADGILFPGGEDIDPSYFGEDPHEKLGIIRPEIDKFSILCAEYAFSKNIPVLGICRGLQVLNVARGGSLYQDISQRDETNIKHLQDYDRSYLLHSIHIDKESLLYKILGEEKTGVNTMHHQSINQLGKSLKVSAYAPDGIIEAIENTDGSLIAVQWHPEELLASSPIMNNLFKYLINKAQEKK